MSVPPGIPKTVRFSGELISRVAAVADRYRLTWSGAVSLLLVEALEAREQDGRTGRMP